MTRSKQEEQIDKDLEQMGVKPYIYHVPATTTFKFRGITVAVDIHAEYNMIQSHVERCIVFALMEEYNHARRFFHAMQTGYGIYGISVCDNRDQFSRKRGRIIAKGRLLKHLKEMKP